jgi:hypothetical protein
MGRISGFHRDEEGDWVAELDCGHTRHMRHDPPWQERTWVTTDAERNARIGTEIECRECTTEAD